MIFIIAKKITTKNSMSPAQLTKVVHVNDIQAMFTFSYVNTKHLFNLYEISMTFLTI